MSTDGKRARNRNAIRQWRRRNTDAGLCQCGNPRRTDETGRVRKTCEVCHARAGGISRRTSDPIVIVRTQLAFAKLTVDVTGDDLAQWEAFAIEFGIPLPIMVKDALELYMAVTRRHEPENPKPVIEEGREAYA